MHQNRVILCGCGGEPSPLSPNIARFFQPCDQKSLANSASLCDSNRQISRAAKRGCFKRGVSRSGLVLPFLSLLGLSRLFWDFPDLSGDSSGIFPICPFPLSWPINSAYEEQSRKGLRHNLDLSRKKWETPRFGNPPV